MKMLTTLAGKQLQKDLAKKRLSTMSSIREDLEGDAGEFYMYDFKRLNPRRELKA